MAYRLTKKALWADLYAAFLCAKRHKANQPYVRHFERRKQELLTELADALWNRTYKPEPSTCFIIERPKKPLCQLQHTQAVIPEREISQNGNIRQRHNYIQQTFKAQVL
jgi:hypothetical protein